MLDRGAILKGTVQQGIVPGTMTDLPSVDIVEMALAEKYFDHFVKQAWPIIVPKRPLIWNWHLGAICEHLQAVTEGQIQYLCMNVPPRHTKSLAVSVFWPTWEWGPANKPWMQYITSSYDQGLSTRDSVKSRRLLQSAWFQARWGDRFELTGDQNAKTRYDNLTGGHRIATSVRGVGTGEGGDRIICDDPHNVTKVESELMRVETQQWWDESMSSRVNDEDTAAYIIIGQRTHANDLFAHVYRKAERGEIDVVKLILPARYEKKRELNLQTRTPLPFKDPRTEEGEPLDQNRYPDEKLKKVEGRMGNAYTIAGQLQQRPTARSGSMFFRENWVVTNQPIPVVDIEMAIRYFDKAATEGGGKRTAGVLMARLKDSGVSRVGAKYVVLDCVADHWGTAKREKIISDVLKNDYERFPAGKYRLYIEQEPGSGGKESAENTVKRNAGYPVYVDKVSGDKETRAEPLATQQQIGNVAVLTRIWTEPYLDEMTAFGPGAEYTDKADASSGAFNKLEAKQKKVGVW